MIFYSYEIIPKTVKRLTLYFNDSAKKLDQLYQNQNLDCHYHLHFLNCLNCEHCGRFVRERWRYRGKDEVETPTNEAEKVKTETT